MDMRYSTQLQGSGVAEEQAFKCIHLTDRAATRKSRSEPAFTNKATTRPVASNSFDGTSRTTPVSQNVCVRRTRSESALPRQLCDLVLIQAE
jgi:hypothetical protein